MAETNQTGQQTIDESREQQYKLEEERAKIEKNEPSGCLIWGFAFLVVACFLSEVGADSVFLLIVLVIVVAIVIMVMVSSDKSKKLDTKREQIQVEQAKKRSVMEQVFEDAKQNGFEPNVTVFDPENKYCIATDNRTRKFLVKNTMDSKFLLFNFSDLVDFDLSQDGASTISSRAGDALVGGVLFGATGAVVGASKSKDIEEYCSSLDVGLTVNSASDFRIQIPIISRKISKTSSQYSFALERAKQMLSLLSLIKKVNEQEVVNNSNELDSIEAVKKYKELLDMGIISQEEFEAKRKELLKI